MCLSCFRCLTFQVWLVTWYTDVVSQPQPEHEPGHNKMSKQGIVTLRQSDVLRQVTVIILLVCHMSILCLVICWSIWELHKSLRISRTSILVLMVFILSYLHTLFSDFIMLLTFFVKWWPHFQNTRSLSLVSQSAAI